MISHIKTKKKIKCQYWVTQLTFEKKKKKKKSCWIIIIEKKNTKKADKYQMIHISKYISNYWHIKWDTYQMTHRSNASCKKKKKKENNHLKKAEIYITSATCINLPWG